MQLEHFSDCLNWWHKREEIKDEQEGSFKARAFDKAEILAGGVNLDLCGYPNQETEVLSPMETILAYQSARDNLNAKIDAQLEKIRTLMGMPSETESE